MKLHVLALLGGAIAVLVATAVGRGRAHDVGQNPRPLQDAMRYYLEGAAAWRRDNPDYVTGGEQPRFWIREYRWGPGHDVLLADAYAVFDGDRCEPIIHLVHTWDAAEGRVTSENFGANGLRFHGSSWSESADVVITEAEGQLPDGSSLRLRDMSDLSNPRVYVSVGHRWDGGAWVVLDTARWERAPNRVCG